MSSVEVGENHPRGIEWPGIWEIDGLTYTPDSHFKKIKLNFVDDRQILQAITSLAGLGRIDTGNRQAMYDLIIQTSCLEQEIKSGVIQEPSELELAEFPIFSLTKDQARVEFLVVGGMKLIFCSQLDLNVFLLGLERTARARRVQSRFPSDDLLLKSAAVMLSGLLNKIHPFLRMSPPQPNFTVERRIK